jgi:hypothetical protein
MVPAKEASCQQRCIPQIWTQIPNSDVRIFIVDDGVMACPGMDVAFGVFCGLGLPVGITLGNFGLGSHKVQTSRNPSALAHP